MTYDVIYCAGVVLPLLWAFPGGKDVLALLRRFSGFIFGEVTGGVVVGVREGDNDKFAKDGVKEVCG